MPIKRCQTCAARRPGRSRILQQKFVLPKRLQPTGLRQSTNQEMPNLRRSRAPTQVSDAAMIRSAAGEAKSPVPFKSPVARRGAEEQGWGEKAGGGGAEKTSARDLMSSCSKCVRVATSLCQRWTSLEQSVRRLFVCLPTLESPNLPQPRSDPTSLSQRNFRVWRWRERSRGLCSEWAVTAQSNAQANSHAS